jgi:hypothetical protein
MGLDLVFGYFGVRVDLKQENGEVTRCRLSISEGQSPEFSIKQSFFYKKRCQSTLNAEKQDA